MKKILYYLFIAALIVIISNNLKTTADFIFQNKVFFTKPKDFTAKDLLPLRLSLKNIHLAGFYVNKTGSDPEFNFAVDFPFEQIKGALAPTILDRTHPLDHEYVIVFLENTKSANQVIHSIRLSTIVAQAGDQIILLRQGKA